MSLFDHTFIDAMGDGLVFLDECEAEAALASFLKQDSMRAFEFPLLPRWGGG